MNKKKLWGGGYSKATANLVERFTESVSYDKRLAPFDILGSMVHAEMLGNTGIIPRKDSKKIISGLKSILDDIQNGKFNWDETLEDLHMNIESALTNRIGEPGKKLHTGRSRNDQVATAFRLYCIDVCGKVGSAVEKIISSINSVTKKFGDCIMPGYTHLQQAQPVTFGMWLGAHKKFFENDILRIERVSDSARQWCPLGSGAIAGSTLPLDRKFTAKKLGFVSPSPSTLQSVADRDFAIELLFVLSMIQLHLSRLAEDLIIYSTAEFGFIKLDDSVTTGSSLMPQKKNPDVCELTRGKTGRVVGNLVSLLVTMKGLPLTYNRDMQEDKEPVFDSVDTVILSLEAMALCIRMLKFNKERALSAIDVSMMATDLVEHLVERKVPFREAHEIIAKLIHSGIDLNNCTEKELEKIHPMLKGSAQRLSPFEAVRRRLKR